MNKRVLVLIALGSMAMAGLKLSAMEEPAVTPPRTFEQVETEMNASQARLDQLNQGFVSLSQLVQQGQKNPNVMVKLQAIMAQRKIEAAKHEKLKAEYDALKQ